MYDAWLRVYNKRCLPEESSLNPDCHYSNHKTTSIDAVPSLEVGIVSAMLVLLSVFAAALLGLTIIVVRRRRINVLLGFEYRLWRRGYLNLVKQYEPSAKRSLLRKKKKSKLTISNPRIIS